MESSCANLMLPSPHPGQTQTTSTVREAHRPAGLIPAGMPEATTERPVRRAIDLQADPLCSALAAGLDKLAHGVALLQIDGRVSFANASARNLLDRHGCWDGSGRAKLRLPPFWAAALQRVCLQGRREWLHLDVAADRAVSVVLGPLSLPDLCLAFAVFGRDELCSSVELQMFALRYQLTPAETAVLRQLCRGLNAAAIAQDHGVARTTVLTQIAAIRAKTQSSSVRSLLDALARMPPVCALVPSMELY